MLQFREGIAKAVSFAGDGRTVGIEQPDLIFALQGKMSPELDCHRIALEHRRGFVSADFHRHSLRNSGSYHVAHSSAAQVVEQSIESSLPASGSP